MANQQRRDSNLETLRSIHGRMSVDTESPIMRIKIAKNGLFAENTNRSLLNRIQTYLSKDINEKKFDLKTSKEKREYLGQPLLQSPKVKKYARFERDDIKFI
ncbi:MAG: hypothetical protein FWD89_01070 [Firmicutes bacterium]|nr:hypothetical protein [Bacillota bacterium]MCL2770884.1 hypothetical protein [Bacillota bacterium]